MARKQADIETTWTPSFIMIRPTSARGMMWIDQHIAGAGEIEHRYIADIVVGALSDGLKVRDTATGRYARAP